MNNTLSLCSISLFNRPVRLAQIANNAGQGVNGKQWINKGFCAMFSFESKMLLFVIVWQRNVVVNFSYFVSG